MQQNLFAGTAILLPELVTVAGGWQHRTRRAFSDAIRGAFGTATGQGADGGPGSKPLSQSEALVLMCIAYFQPITRGELSQFFGKKVSRDLIGILRAQNFIVSGPRSPQPGAPYTYVTTKQFLVHFEFDTLRDLPDFEALEDAGLLSKEKLLAGDLPAFFDADDEESSSEDAVFDTTVPDDELASGETTSSTGSTSR